MLMKSGTQSSTEAWKELTLEILEQTFGRVLGQNVQFRLWDGTQWPGDAAGAAVLALKHPGALRSMLRPGTEVGLAEAYLRDDFDIEGDMEAALAAAEAAVSALPAWSAKLRAGARLLRLPAAAAGSTSRAPAVLTGSAHSFERDRQAISYHYDVSNDFFRIWLDPRMVYSCAYFRQPSQGLEQAQEDKLEYICRKLRLKPGQRLLDIGCGWGGLALYAAQRYRVTVTGITLSEPQVQEARRRAADLGVGERVEFRVQDYRQMQEVEAFDALVSVGMFEHVGQALLPDYFRIAARLLRPGGVFLNHGIACWGPQPQRQEPTFVQRHVFPDGELTPIAATLRCAEAAGFEVRDVESLREHYALTLRHWGRRLEQAHDEVRRWVDEPTYRVWRLFMSGSAHGFARGRLNVYQTLLLKQARDGASHLPLTRDDWLLS